MQNFEKLWQSMLASAAARQHVMNMLREHEGRSLPPEQVAKESLQALWIRFDTGGIIAGRMLRAEILEEVLFLLRCGFQTEAKEVLGVLIAMYHSPEYIEENKWFDFTVTRETLPLEERVLLIVAGRNLGVENVPLIESCTKENVDKLLLEAQKKRRAYAWGA